MLNTDIKYPYHDSLLSVEKRIEDLVGRMTQEEKIRQLDMYWGKEVTKMVGHEAREYSAEMTSNIIGDTGIGSIHDFYPISAELTNKIQKYALENTRLGIPVLFIEEGLHGYEGLGSTTFPIPLQLASAWDPPLMQKIGRVIATEARAHGVCMILGPVLCLARDPRWGRIEETFGEDPYLAAVNGVAMVKGLQGENLKNPDSVVAEPKHFAVHGIPEAGSNTSPVNIGEREARSSFLYVFEKAVREGGAMGIMAAFHEIDGIPCVVSRWLLTGILRDEWNFKGLVLSDLGAIKLTLVTHCVADTIPDALAQTFNAGMNMQFYDFSHEDFQNGMKEAIENKSIPEDNLNKAVEGVLRVKFLLGLFDNPYIDSHLLSRVFHTRGNQDLALQAAREGIVLLKNENGILPLIKKYNSVAVVGSLAISAYPGGYANKECKAITILDGLKQKAGNFQKIIFKKGYEFGASGENQSGLILEAVTAVKKCQLAIVVAGEDISKIGEGKDRACLDLEESQMDLVKAIHETGNPVIVVLVNGRPLTINWIAKNVPVILETWFSGEMAGMAIADVLLGNNNPSGKLPVTFPRSAGQIPYYYNHKPTSAHSYVDEADTPLFPFGFGLSYTSFDYSGLNINPLKITPDGNTDISVIIKNTGKAEGAEIVQLYIKDVVASVTTPMIALKGFERVELKPGESGIVKFKIGKEHLSLWNREMKREVEPGKFIVLVGSSSEDIRLMGNFYVTVQESNTI